MPKHRIEPHQVTKPMQLLAAWLVALIALDAAFLGGAKLIASPTWVTPMLAIAAIVNVPIFLVCMFLLQTWFRPEMQEDAYYANYLKDKTNAVALGRRLRTSLGEAGLDPQSLSRGRALSEASEEAQTKVRILLTDLQNAVEKLRREHPQPKAQADQSALLALAEGLMAEQRWLEAAEKLAEYANLHPENWEASFLRGVAFANSRRGRDAELNALRAYNDAITFATDSIDPNIRARLFAYRGAMLKRLGRLDEAEVDLRFAKTFASREYEINDISYNLACVYAMRNDRRKLFEMLDALKGAPSVLSGIRAHLHDYFRLFAADREFLGAVGASTVATMDQAAKNQGPNKGGSQG